MTDLSFHVSQDHAAQDFAPNLRAMKARLQAALKDLPRMAISLPVTLLLMVPDSEVHAKLFKLAMILDNLNQRVLSNSWT